MPQQLELSDLAQPALVLALNVYIVTFLFRRGLESAFKRLKGHYIWEDLVLVSLPVFFGALFALIPSYPLPQIFSVNPWTKMAFGAPVGASSSLIYRIIKSLVKKNFGIDVDGKSVPPPAAEEEK